MKRSSRFTLISAITVASAPLVFAASAGAQSSAAKSDNSAPSGWVGLSVIQNGGSADGNTVKLAYPVVASVDPGSPAQTAGLVAGDTIIAYNDVNANSDPLAVKRFLKPGNELVVSVRRNGLRKLTMTVARRTARNPFSEGVTISANEEVGSALLASVPSGPIAIAVPVAAGRSAPFAGSYLASMNAGLASALGVQNSGVLVIDVGNGSAAMRAGLQPGDVITQADSLKVASPLEIATAMRLASTHSITVNISRRGKTQQLTIRW